MPIVPRYDSFQAQHTGQPNIRIDAPQMPDVAGRQAQQLGHDMQRLGHDVRKIALDVQQQANQLRVDDALNRAKEESLRLTFDQEVGFSNLKGINALERPEGKPLTEEYGGILQKRMSDIASTLGNDVQRQAFMAHSSDILTAFKGKLIQHEAEEYKGYALSTSEGIINTAQRDISLNWNDIDVVLSAHERVRAEVYRQQQLLGKSAEWGESMSRKMTSDAHKLALLSALEQNEALYADAYLKRFSEQMNADDILTVRGHITKAVDTQVGQAAAVEVMTRLQPRIQVGETERAYNILLGTESGKRQFDANGAPLTSSKGAVGIAQVMPQTALEAAKLAGLAWDENRYKKDAAYNRALGLAYFQKQLQDNGGDLAMGYAAYNAGPSALVQAIKKADLKENEGKTYLDFLPTETQQYVATNMAAFGAGAGQPKRATLQDIDSQLRADPRLATHPERYKVARSEATRLFDDQTKAIKQHEEAAVADAMRGIIQNGGRYSDLPLSMRAALPPDKVDDLISFGQKVSKGDDTTSLWLYNKLSNNATYLAELSDDEFFALRRELSETDFKHFSNERAKINGAGQGSTGFNDLNSGAIKQTLDNRLRMLEINPNPKDDGGGDAARIGAIRQFVNQDILVAQREAGHKFTDAEVTQHLDTLFAKSAKLKGWLGFGSTSKNLMEAKTSRIPNADKDSIRAAYIKQGIDDPTDAQILNAYLNMKAARQ